MAALKINPDNSITLPFPLLAIIVTVFLAIAGWGASIRSDVAAAKQEVGKLQDWKADHIKEADSRLRELQASIAETKNMVITTGAASTKQNAELQETLTTVRIQLAARR
jgi:hypothetical protein